MLNLGSEICGGYYKYFYGFRLGSMGTCVTNSTTYYSDHPDQN